MRACPKFLQRLCGPEVRRRDDRTTETIDEAERTRRELARLTARLAEHVEVLKVLTQAYMQQYQEESDRGRVEAADPSA